MRSFYSFENGASSQHLESGSVINFLTHLAVEHKVARLKKAA